MAIFLLNFFNVIETNSMCLIILVSYNSYYLKSHYFLKELINIPHESFLNPEGQCRGRYSIAGQQN